MVFLDSIKSFCLLGLVVCISSGSVWAEANPLAQRASEDVYTYLGRVARENIDKAFFADGSPVPKETPEELAKPIISPQEIKFFVDRAIQADTIRACGLDAQRYTNYLMNSEQARHHWSDKQFQYIGFLYGLSMGYFEKPVFRKGCSPETKQSLLKQLK